MERIEIIDGFSAPDGACILKAHYGDPPMKRLPKRIIAMLLEQWARRADVTYRIALYDRRFAGFIFAQAVGAQPWRSLLAHWFALPFAILAWISTRRPLQASRDEPSRRPDLTEPASGYETYSPDMAVQPAATVEFVFVATSFRGLQVAGNLLADFERLATARGARTLLAYIAVGNEASVRAFEKAGWTVYQDVGTLRAVRRIT